MRKNLGMLALIMAFWFTISFITNILGPLIPDIIHNFNLSDLAMAGFIPTSFFLAYAIMSIPAGLLIDRFGEKPDRRIRYCVSLRRGICRLFRLLFGKWDNHRLF